MFDCASPGLVVSEATSYFGNMAECRVRVSDLLKHYEDNAISADICEWLQKLELVAQLQKIKDLAGILPLSLSGSAFAVYNQLDEGVRMDYKKLKGELLLAFRMNSFHAHGTLLGRKYRSGETVDAYVADLRRLVSLIGQTEPEPLLKCAFVEGLPPDVSVQLKSIAAVEKLSLVELISRARMIMSTNDEVSCAVG